MDLFNPIQIFADFITFNLFGLADSSYFAAALNFFIYDVLKIGLLLIVINFFMAVVRHYLPIAKMKSILTKRKWYGLDYLLAALLGMITPFCSCSSVPLFIGFLSAGIPLGITFTFLISSPLINESSLLLFPSLFGIKTTLLYNLLGIVISILGGILIQKLKLERFINTDLLKFQNHKLDTSNSQKKIPLKKLLSYFWQDGFAITKSIFPYVILGVAIGALIHGFVPQQLVEQYLSQKEWWTVPLATLMGVPLYANSVSIIPIIQALVLKGVPLGTSLAFMTATVALSIPEALILKKVMKWQLLATFFAITIAGILLIGYIFNWLN